MKKERAAWCVGLVTMLVVAGWCGVVEASLMKTFQNGLNGYTGTQDTMVERYSANNVNYGGNPDFDVAGALGNVGYSGLLKFGNLFGTGTNQVPAGATIVSAQLTLTAFTRYQPTSGSYAIEHTMLKDWVAGTASSVAQEGSSCFNARHYRSDGNYAANPGDAWGTDGVIHTGPVRSVDYATDGTAYCYFNSAVDVENKTDYEMNFDLTSTVQAWQANPSSNFGMFFRTNQTWAYAYFYSSDNSALDKRPELVITYTPEPATLGLLLSGLGGFFLRRKNSGF
jgi:hypothetical protein